MERVRDMEKSKKGDGERKTAMSKRMDTRDLRKVIHRHRCKKI